MEGMYGISEIEKRVKEKYHKLRGNTYSAEWVNYAAAIDAVSNVENPEHLELIARFARRIVN